MEVTPQGGRPRVKSVIVRPPQTLRSDEEKKANKKKSALGKTSFGGSYPKLNRSNFLKEFAQPAYANRLEDTATRLARQKWT